MYLTSTRAVRTTDHRHISLLCSVVELSKLYRRSVPDNLGALCTIYFRSACWEPVVENFNALQTICPDAERAESKISEGLSTRQE